MNTDQFIHVDLPEPPLPVGLVPPADLADRVLGAQRRRQQARVLLAAGAALVAVGVGVPAVLTTITGPGTGSALLPGGPASQSPKPTDQTATPGEPVFPTPGGGPKAIQVYPIAGKTYLLDPATGKYRAMSVAVELSPDLTWAAIVDGDRVGLADRLALVREGPTAVQWLEIPMGNGLSWSPDGTAFVITSIDKSAGSGTPKFTAHRYTVATGTVTDTPINIDILGGSVGWAADSRRYVALLPGTRTNDTVEPGALQSVNPNGTLGQRLDIRGGTVRGAASYSPSGNRVIADASDLMSAAPLPSQVVDLRTGQPVASIPANVKPIGWYDEQTVIQMAAPFTDLPTLELVDLATGTVKRRIELPGLRYDGDSTIQIGDAAGLSGEAAKLGF